MILILIGAMFFANNLRPDMPMLEFFGRYWPFLLIAWGLSGWWRSSSGRSAASLCPRSGVSGGEWVAGRYS